VDRDAITDTRLLVLVLFLVQCIEHAQPSMPAFVLRARWWSSLVIVAVLMVLQVRLGCLLWGAEDAEVIEAAG
jgi:hypothetical protein